MDSRSEDRLDVGEQSTISTPESRYHPAHHAVCPVQTRRNLPDPFEVLASRRCNQETAAGLDLPTIAYDPEEQFPITHSVIVLHDLPGNNSDILERFAREIFNNDAELTQVTRPDSLRCTFPTFRWIFAARTQKARTILGHREEMRPRWARHTSLPNVNIVFDSVLAIVEAEQVRYSAAKVANPRSRIFLAGLGSGFNIAAKLFFREPQAVGGLGGLIGLAGSFWMSNLPYLMAVARDFGPDSDNDNEKCRHFLKALRALYRGRKSYQSQNTASTEATSQDHVSLVRKLRETPIFLAYDPHLDEIGIEAGEGLWMSELLQYVLRFKQVQYHDYTPEPAPVPLTDTLWQRMLADIVAFLKSRSIQALNPLRLQATWEDKKPRVSRLAGHKG